MRYSFLTITILFVGLVAVHATQAQVMSSTNFQLQSDSINVGGGNSTSSNYIQESTLGEIATGRLESANYSLRAGYQQMQEVYLALNGGESVTMSPNIPGVTGGESNGSTTVTVVTDSPAGYQLTIESSADPSMSDGSNSIADYTPSGGSPDLAFSVTSADAYFGFSPFGDDVVERFQTDGVTCNVSGAASSTACWDGLSTSAITIAQSTSANQPDGTDTTIYYKVGVGDAALQPPGSYVATTTITLLSL